MPLSTLRPSRRNIPQTFSLPCNLWLQTLRKFAKAAQEIPNAGGFLGAFLGTELPISPNPWPY